jgi:hypothetical protein
MDLAIVLVIRIRMNGLDYCSMADFRRCGLKSTNSKAGGLVQSRAKQNTGIH